jgi:hypothetical protein
VVGRREIRIAVRIQVGGEYPRLWSWPSVFDTQSLGKAALLARREYRLRRERSQGMSLFILSVAALATTLPCLFVWFADAARRPDRARHAG